MVCGLLAVMLFLVVDISFGAGSLALAQGKDAVTSLPDEGFGRKVLDIQIMGSYCL